MDQNGKPDKYNTIYYWVIFQTQLKLKRDCRIANATSRLQQMQLQPCASITCAGSRRTNVQPSPVQVDNRSPPVLSWSARYDCQTYLTLFFLFEQKMALTISYLKWNWRLICMTFECALQNNHIFTLTKLVIFNSIHTQCENVLIQLNRKKRVWNKGLTFSK